MTTKALRKRLGARLLVERLQERNWNELKAAQEAGLTPRTIRRIERGENYEIESLEKYAIALGRPIDDWLYEVLLKEQETQRAAAAERHPASTTSAGSTFQRTGTDSAGRDPVPPHRRTGEKPDSGHRQRTGER